MSEESSINQGIAKAFAGILAAIHGIVFFGAAYLLFQYNDRSGAIRRLLDAFEISFTGYATIVGMALIFYILSVGAIATLIAMNENLRSIRFELANRRMTADVAESNDETTNGTRIETPSRPLINRTPRVVTDSHDDLMLYFGMAGFVAFILVIAMWIA